MLSCFYINLFLVLKKIEDLEKIRPFKGFNFKIGNIHFDNKDIDTSTQFFLACIISIENLLCLDIVDKFASVAQNNSNKF